MNTIIRSFLILILMVPSLSQAHGGRLNSQGCHAGKQPYHCHRSSSQMERSSSGGYRLKCSNGSRSKDCRSETRNARRYDIGEIQSRLVYHCSSIRHNFVDGRWGPNTERAIKKFQRSYGLSADGIVGQNTMRALRGARNGKCN